MLKYRKHLFEQLKSIKNGEQSVIHFDHIARAAYDGNDATPDYEKWKKRNKPTIIQLFETWCRETGCICQECTFGPYKGNFYVTVQPPELTPQDVWPFNQGVSGSRTY